MLWVNYLLVHPWGCASEGAIAKHVAHTSLEINWTLYPVFFSLLSFDYCLYQMVETLCLEYRGILNSVSSVNRTFFLVGPSYSFYLARTSPLKILAISALWQWQICGAQHFSSLRKNSFDFESSLLSIMHWVKCLWNRTSEIYLQTHRSLHSDYPRAEHLDSTRSKHCSSSLFLGLLCLSSTFHCLLSPLLWSLFS